MDPRIGTELAGHRIEAVIGRGGASVVYLAEHVRLERKVALKVLAPHLAEDESFRERFIRESRIAGALDHPNIVTIYDAGEVEDVLYISMRYIVGGDLGKVLRAERSIEPSRAVAILGQVAAALDVAHGKGLVHRDVKPGNVLLETADTGIERAFLADFGISKRTTSGAGLTRTGHFVGTVNYVAPEQISGEPVDGRTDVYSLGCVLFQCLTGDVPFPGDTEVATIYRQLHDPPPTYDAHGGSTGMDEVVARVLSKSKEDRYPTCIGFIEAARAALEETRASPTVARPVGAGASSGRDTRVDATRPAHRRWRHVWVGAAGVGIAAVVAAVLLALSGGEAPGPAGSDGTGNEAETTTGAPPTSERFVDPTWTLVKERSKADDQSMDDVIATADGRLVVVGHVEEVGGGEDGAVWLATDIDRWRRSGLDVLGGPGDQRLLTVTEFGDVLVAGGWRDGATGHEAVVWSSRDGGISWEGPSALPDGGPGEVRSLAVLGSTVVAVGGLGPVGFEDAAVWTSSDGITWDRSLDLDLQPEGDQELWSVNAASGMLVAVGSSEGVDGSFDAAVWTSTDLTDWSRVDPAMFEAPGNQLMKAVAGGVEGLPFVIVGCEGEQFLCDSDAPDSDAAVWASEDGEDWEKVPLEGRGLVGEGIQTMVDVVREGDHFVAVGRVTANPGDLDGADWISADGREWELQLTPGNKVADLGGPGDQAIRALTRYRRGSRFVAVGVTSVTDQDAVAWGGS